MSGVERWNGGATYAGSPVVHPVKQSAALLLKAWGWRKHQRIAQLESPLRPKHHHRIFDEVFFKRKVGGAACSYRTVQLSCRRLWNEAKEKYELDPSKKK